MKQEKNINVLVGDLVHHYESCRFSRTYIESKDPTDVIFTVDIDQPRENTTHLLITDGVVNEFDFCRTVPDATGEGYDLRISKKIKFCKATYGIHIYFTRSTPDVYTAMKIYVYMKDPSKIDEIYGQIPNDVYFW